MTSCMCRWFIDSDRVLTMKRLTLLLLIGFLSWQSPILAKDVGSVTYSRGVLTGQLGAELPRLIGKNERLREGETLSTGSRGLAIISLSDGSKMTLRPGTKFKIQSMDESPGKENAILSLFRGGLRAITGRISKRNPNAFKINTAVATIGIRGTEFDARLCDGAECDTEERRSGKQASDDSKVIGRIALMRGSVGAVADDDRERRLSVGGAVYERDQIKTGINSFTVIAFNDKSRVTMTQNSAFVIDSHQYDPEEPKDNNAFLRFVRGGLRIVSGAIGKLNRPAYRVATPTATIGIRGTGFDLVCEGSCSDEDKSALYDPANETPIKRLLAWFIKPAYAQGSSGMYTQVWSGAIEFQLPSGTLTLSQGKVAFLQNGFSKPVILPQLPAFIQNELGSTPRPDGVDVPEDSFGGVEQDQVQPGLYVNVREGDVVMQGNDGTQTNLGAGEAGVSALDGKTVRLSLVPAFQKFDPLPQPQNFTPETETMLNLFGSEEGEDKEFECTLQ